MSNQKEKFKVPWVPDNSLPLHLGCQPLGFLYERIKPCVIMAVIFKVRFPHNSNIVTWQLVKTTVSRRILDLLNQNLGMGSRNMIFFKFHSLFYCFNFCKKKMRYS